MIGEHSYSRPQMPVAESRPDALDLEEAVRFGENVSGRIGLYCGSVLPERLNVRGCRPYKIKGPSLSSLLSGMKICVPDAGFAREYVWQALSASLPALSPRTRIYARSAVPVSRTVLQEH